MEPLTSLHRKPPEQHGEGGADEMNPRHLTTPIGSREAQSLIEV